MLLYEVNDEIQSHMHHNQVIVYDYKIGKQGQLVLDLLDKQTNKLLKVQAFNYKVSEELFEMKGHPVKALTLRGTQKIFKNYFFTLAGLVVENVQNTEQRIVIQGGVA